MSAQQQIKADYVAALRESGFTLERFPWIPRWVAALRSGEYPQTTGVIAQQAGAGDHSWHYCCLGVAGKAVFGMSDFSFSSSSAACADMGLGGLGHDFMEMNDSSELTFSEIADVIEEAIGP